MPATAIATVYRVLGQGTMRVVCQRCGFTARGEVSIAYIDRELSRAPWPDRFPCPRRFCGGPIELYFGCL